MKKQINIYYLFSVLIMFIFLFFPAEPTLDFIFGIHMIFNSAWTIKLIIDYFKK
jgi:hypothetical protein